MSTNYAQYVVLKTVKLGKLKEMLDVCFSQLNRFYNRYEIADLSRSVII